VKLNFDDSGERSNKKNGSFTQPSSNEEVIVFEKSLKKLHDFVAMRSLAFETVAFECGSVIEKRCMAKTK